MPLHNKDAKVFGDQVTDSQDVELNESDVEILEVLSSEQVTMENKELQPIVKLEKIKSEFRPVGFSKGKHQTAAKYNRALKALL